MKFLWGERPRVGRTKSRMGVAQWCNTCCAHVEGTVHCVYGMCPFHPERREEPKEMEMPVKIKEIKCTKCKERVPFSKEAMDLAANTCKYRLRTDHMACGMKQWAEFVEKETKHKNLPALLVPLQIIGGELVVPARGSYPERDFQSAVIEPEPEFFELDMPKVLRTEISKKGHVTNSVEQ